MEPFKVDGVEYASLGEAITAAAAEGGAIRLLSNAGNEGVSVAENSNFVLDLNGHTLDLTGPGAGSSGTETQGLQLLKGSEVVIKNGTIIFSDDPRLKMGIQNYCNLTLDNVKISGGSNITYVVSNNYGNVVFKNKTTITAAEGRVAFDCWYGMSSVYDDPGVFITVADNSVKINGKVEFGKAGRASEENFAQHASITCPEEMELDVTLLNTPCEWTHNASDSTKTLRYVYNA